MRKKLITTTYLRDVKKYNIKMYFDNEDYFLSVKRILDTVPFVLSNGLCIIDNGYYVLEIIPKNENYSLRVFFNEKKERLQYYFDISLENGLDESTKVPYYTDLFTDIIITNGKVEVVDEDELYDAFVGGIITAKDFKLANETRDKLLNEINDGINKYMNMNFEKFL